MPGAPGSFPIGAAVTMRDLDTNLADKFVGMYVNERTLDYGDDGRAAIRRLLAMGHERGVIPHSVQVDFVG